MVVFPWLGKLILKYAVPMAVEKIVSLAWGKIFKKKEPGEKSND